jgi:FAD/FMN-containing dehydrogenase
MLSAQELSTKIKEFFTGDVEFDTATLDLYSHDASLFEIKPTIVCFPKNKEDVEKLVSFVETNKKDHPELSITARSAGTDMSGGAINESIILVFTKYMNHIGEVNIDGTVVEPGTFYRDFETETLKKQLIMPSYPASKGLCALGGIVNNNSGGEKTLAFGKTIDYVEELKMVLSDGKTYQFKKLNKQELEEKLSKEDFEGEIYKKVYKMVTENYDLIKDAKPKVSKNSTGYNIWDVYDKEKEEFDLSKIFVGAQGTLGINIESTLRLVEKKPFSGLLVIYLNDMKILPHLITDVVADKPESFEVFDDNTLKLAIRFMPQFIKILGVTGTISMGLQFTPDLIRFMFQGIPKFTLLVECDGDNQQEVNTRLEALQKKLKTYPIRMELAESAREAQNFWTIRRESFSLLRKNVKKKHTAPFIDDFCIRPEYVIEFFPKLIKILEEHQINYTIAGHMGDGNFHIIPLMDFNNKEETAKIPVVEDLVNNLVFEYKGSISGEHNEGLIRGYYLKKMYGEQMFNIFREIKKIFDPNDIFNPHKKTDASLEYSLSHIRSNF